MAQPVDYSDLQVGRPQPPSDLEVGQRPQHQSEDYSTLQPNRPELSLYDTHKESTRPWQHSPDSAASAPEKYDPAAADPVRSSPRSRTIFGLRRRTFWIVIMVVLVIIAAIIGGAVGGTVGSNHKGKSIAPSSTGSGNASPANAPSVPPASRILGSTRLATAGWNDSQAIQQQRVYLQATDNMIWELSWNSSGKVWSTSSEAIAQAKSGSPLVAAVSYENRVTVSPKSRNNWKLLS